MDGTVHDCDTRGGTCSSRLSATIDQAEKNEGEKAVKRRKVERADISL
jgi:hypothetical protein